MDALCHRLHNLSVEQFFERYRVVGHQILKRSQQRGIDLRVGGDDGGLMAIASSKVLRGDNRHLERVGIALDEDKLAVVIHEEDLVNGLHQERPQAQRLVGGFKVKQQLYVLDLAIAAQEVKAAHELLRDGERCLPNGVGWIQLPEAPFDDISHLQRIGQIGLQGLLPQWAENAVNCSHSCAGYSS